MHDQHLTFSCGQQVDGIDECTIDRQGALASAGDEKLQRLFRLAWRNREEFFANGTASHHGFCSPRFGRDFVACGDALGKPRKDLVGKPGFGIRLENHVGDTFQPGS